MKTRIGACILFINRFTKRDIYTVAMRHFRRGEWILFLKRVKAYIIDSYITARYTANMQSVDNELHDSKNPFISVIVPCFNYGRFVEEAIDSVLAQTFTDFEIIVVEGGSTDNETRTILKSLNKPKTKILFRDGQHMVGSNRNFGIENATGRYICCLDADDKIAPTYLEKALFILEHECYDITSSSLRFFGDRNDTCGVMEKPLLEDMILGNHIFTSAIFRRSLFNKVGGYVDTGIGSAHVPEDWDLWLRMAAMGARIRNIVGENLFYYRQHGNTSLSSTATMSLQDQGLLILRRNKSLLTRHAHYVSRFRALQSYVSKSGVELLAAAQNKNLPAVRNSILFILPYIVTGGVEKLFSALTRHLMKIGWHVVIVTTLPHPKEYKSARDWFESPDTNIYELPRFLYEHEYEDFIKYLVEGHAINCIVNAGSVYFYDIMPAFKKEHPTIAIVDVLFNTVGHTANHALRREHITMALCENSETMAWLHTHWGLSSRTTCITSGINLEKFKPTPKNTVLLKKYAIKQDAVVVGFAGRFSEEKGIDTLINIIKTFPASKNIHFLILGNGPLEQRLRTAVEKAQGVAVTIVPHVEDMPAYYNLFDILLLPSTIDGRPLAVMEAMASGCAIVASRVGGLPDMISDGKNGTLCEPGNTRAFIESIQDLAAMPSKLAEFKKESRGLAETNMDEQAMFSRYVQSFYNAIRLIEFGDNHHPST